MPLYAYQCPKCFKIFDQFNSIGQRDYQLCPDCTTLCNRVISPCNFILKGKGWARDNYEKSN